MDKNNDMLITVLNQLKEYDLENALTDPNFKKINFLNVVAAKHITIDKDINIDDLDNIYMLLSDFKNDKIEKYKKIFNHDEYKKFLKELYDFCMKTKYKPESIDLSNIREAIEKEYIY